MSLAFTTYQIGQAVLHRRASAGRGRSCRGCIERTFNRCMGLAGDGQTLWMSSLYQLWRFENALAPGELHQGCDRLFVPQAGYTTGDIDIHDIALDARTAARSSSARCSRASRR